jgi:hypothetical protein
MAPEGQHAGGPTSTPATVVDEDVFDIVARLEIHKSLRLQYPVSLVVIRADVDDSRPEGGLAAQLTRIVASVLRSTDVVAVHRKTAGTTVHLLLIDAHQDHLPTVTRRIRDEVDHHHFRLNDEAVQLRFTMGTASFPITASTLEDLRAQAMSRATA